MLRQVLLQMSLFVKKTIRAGPGCLDQGQLAYELREPGAMILLISQDTSCRDKT